MFERKTLVPLLFLSILAIQQKTSEAGPVKRSRREVYPPDIEPESIDINPPQVCIVGDVVYAVDEPVPAEQPCLKCRCQPPGVQCETIKCAKKPGCKAVHRPNSCCPDYQCECQHNGRVYGNGEKLDTPLGGECKVCYCRGGEIQCANVSCYIRKDCEGRSVPGTCCPKYDHCPPIDSFLEGSVTTELTLKNIDQESLEVLPLPSVTTNETFLGQTTNEIPDEYKPNKELEKEINLELTNKLSHTAHVEIEDLELLNDAISQPKITIQEIIPEIKEIPITASPRVEESLQTQGQLIIEETNKDETNDLVVTDSEPDSSEITEVFQQPPPVLRIGDKLLFLKKGEFIPEKDTSTPTSVITIIGAEGLQRGFEESAESHDYLEHKENITETNDLELKTSESSHILSLVKRKNKNGEATTTAAPISTTEAVLNISEEVSLESSTTTVSYNMTESTENTTTETSVTSDLPETLTTSEQPLNLTTEVKPSTTEKLENPEYPPIPDIMITQEETAHPDDTSQRFDNNNENDSTNSTTDIEEPIMDMKILPEVLEVRNNKTLPENTTHSEWLKNESVSIMAAITEIPVINITETTDKSVDFTISKTDDITTEKLDATTVKSVETFTTLTESSTNDRSVETIEESTEESGEHTTEKMKTSPIKYSNEDISLEGENMEIKDMMKENKDVAEGSVESSTINIADDVEFIGEIQKIDDFKPIVNKDVEVITFKVTIESTTRPEELPKPEKSIGKRENSAEEQADEVFKQLDLELNAENTERILTREQEQREADEIFKDLLEETSTPKTLAAEGRNKDSDTLQRVSDALARLTLRGKQPDSNILGILTNFFSSQYRYRK
ncbi:unnamed protein product [Brassicogethes aeneus]|uniref:VWFC domain-containing protein n=1 Tax=Brassicogethes aeneus TaxID=1431903 RepID=A0A9P0B598_BRAAE|nr:unnamed protein product [Brassicogethes aeneus]